MGKINKAPSDGWHFRRTKSSTKVFHCQALLKARFSCLVQRESKRNTSNSPHSETGGNYDPKMLGVMAILFTHCPGKNIVSCNAQPFQRLEASLEEGHETAHDGTLNGTEVLVVHSPRKQGANAQVPKQPSWVFMRLLKTRWIEQTELNSNQRSP